MVTGDNSVIIEAADRIGVMVLFSREKENEPSVPVGPEALGYLTATSDGYLFVRSTRPGIENAPAEQCAQPWTLQFEESCF